MRDAAQIECLSSKWKALGSVFRPFPIPVISTLGRWRGEDQELKVILGFIASLRLAWATRDLEGKLTLLLFPLSPEL